MHVKPRCEISRPPTRCSFSIWFSDAWRGPGFAGKIHIPGQSYEAIAQRLIRSPAGVHWHHLRHSDCA